LLLFFLEVSTQPLYEESIANDHTEGFENVVCISAAKVPIVKVWDPKLKLACDMNVNNTLALENTRMIRTYVEIDPRVRQLAMLVKYWTRQRKLNDAGELIRSIRQSLANIFLSLWWYTELIYMDLPDHRLPSIAEPAGLTCVAPVAIQDAQV
jgi:hypothetical protein